MVELSALWVGLSRADAGRALRGFVLNGGEPRGCDVEDFVRRADLSAWQRSVLRAARPAAVPDAICFGDARYPKGLADAYDAPPVLYVHGDASCLHAEWAVGIVGTRACTPQAAADARRIAYAVARSGATVVSGLARGIDGEAHRSALEVGRTAAVLGHGLGMTAPRSHERLRKAMVDRGGAVVSSWPEDVEPTRWSFPRRNRWIAALSHHVVVVEAGATSGALITAKEAVELGRQVWVVPGGLQPHNAGGHALVDLGARLLYDLDIFLEAIAADAVPAPAPWLDRLFAGDSLDTIARSRQRTIHEVLIEVGQLELDGVVVPCSGGRYRPGAGAASRGAEGPAERGDPGYGPGEEETWRR